MAGTPPPEELVGEAESPFSPSHFLDLPATPHHAKDNVVDLDFISRVLMEDDIDGKLFYDHSALLQSQRQYAKALLLPDDPATNSSNSTPSSSASDGTNDCSTDAIDYTRKSFLSGDGVPTAPFFQQSPPLFDRGDTGQNHGVCPAETGGGDYGAPVTPLFTHQTEDEKPSLVSDDAPNNPTNWILHSDDLDSLEFHHNPAFFGGACSEGGGAFLMDAAQSSVSTDMLDKAFFKGMEEANKFLPGCNKLGGVAGGEARKHEVLLVATMLNFGNGQGRKNRQDAEALAVENNRSRKIMMPDREEPGAVEMYDEMMLHEYDMCMKGMEDLRLAMDAEKKGRMLLGQGVSEAVDFHTMLVRCAQAVAMGDHRSAADLIRQVRQHASPKGDGMQRLAHWFAVALEARLAGTGSQLYKSMDTRRAMVVEYLSAYKLFTAACCLREVTFAFSSKTIYNIVAGKSQLHIIDYGVQFGLHWPALLKELAEREGGPPEVRITGIDLPEHGFRPAYQIEETGRRLSHCAHEFGVPFKYRSIAARWDTICAEDLNINPDEVLVVSAQSGFGKLMDESVVMDTRNPRDVVVSNIQKMKPDVYIECVLNATHGAPFFVTRFKEAMFFYSTHFDMMDATIPRDNPERQLIEQGLFAKWITNIVACEGADRVDRPETYKQWKVRNHRVGLRQLPLNPEVVKLVTDRVKNHYHKDFLIYADGKWLFQGWKGRVLWALSTWVPEHDKSRV